MSVLFSSEQSARVGAWQHMAYWRLLSKMVQSQPGDGPTLYSGIGMGEGWVCKSDSSKTNQQTLFAASHFYSVSVQGRAQVMLISSEILFRAVEGIPAWGQGVKTSVVTRVFVLGYSVLLSKCVSQLLSAAGALVQLST